MLSSDVTPDRRSVVIVNASMTVSSCKANKICLGHITLKMISTERIADSQGLAFFFFWFDLRPDFATIQISFFGT